MDPSAALYSIENSLRLAVRERLPNWFELLGHRAQRAITTSRQDEVDARAGVAHSAELIDFTYTRQLVRLVTENWDQFADVFGDESIATGLMAFVTTVRNAPAHARDLLPFERDLLSGIAGRLSNQVGLWRTRDGSEFRHYPMIETVVDRFGDSGTAWIFPGDASTESRPARVQVGDTITWQCRAIPSGRNFDPKWALGEKTSPGGLTFGFPMRVPDGIQMPQPIVEVGESAELSLTIHSGHVSQAFWVAVMLSTDSAHHRHRNDLANVRPGYDDVRYFVYEVLPPEDE